MLEIITDSASDIPLEIKEYYHLHVIPTPVVIDGEDYLDGETIRPSEFYEIQREGKREISTYHINPDMFEEAFRRYAEAGTPVLYVCFSTGIAATWNAAHIARENLLEEYPAFDLNMCGQPVRFGGLWAAGVLSAAPSGEGGGPGNASGGGGVLPGAYPPCVYGGYPGVSDSRWKDYEGQGDGGGDAVHPAGDYGG